ncbi:HEPN domain-containing protein [Magnetospirillum sp. SS-4]|uniref:HEPN domain-containing protein n=1 Tax=Magnetospirillum sp. SS-4 TaxID=2681465 RepID=UPI0015746C8E|nr:HEPN domain-containing protein [Magnetospirillum sp. SS-4]
MRKISPNDIRDDFRQQLSDLTTFHNTGFAAFTSEADQSTLTEHSLLAAAVTWEGFVSDMFIAYINRDATRFKQHLKDSFETHLNASSTPKRVFDAFGTLTFPLHLKKADVLALANSMGNNITFPNFDQLEQKAGTWLVAAHAAKFSGLTAQQKAVVNSVIALRNNIAHRSKRSLDAMNDVLALGVLHPTGIRRLNNRFHNVGAWLKSIPVGCRETRFVIIINILDGIGAAF